MSNAPFTSEIRDGRKRPTTDQRHQANGHDPTDTQNRAQPTPWWRDPATIPKRQSLYAGHYFRGAIGATIAAGGRAKTTLAVYEAVCMAAGFDLASKVAIPAGQLRVWLINGEEDQDEIDRRVAATCQCYGITREELGGRLYAPSVRNRPLRIAKLVNGLPVIDQGSVRYMEDVIRAQNIDVFMIDPLISFHSVNENSNADMDTVIKEGFAGIAGRTNAAGEVFHHPGKPRMGQSVGAAGPLQIRHHSGHGTGAATGADWLISGRSAFA